jgi:hypothetical protein
MRALAVSIALAAATLSACVGPVAGNGKVETERRTVPAFSSVSVGGTGNVRIHRGPTKVEVTADSNLLSLLETEVVGSELRIGFKPGTMVTRITKLEIDVTTPDLSALDLSGSASTTVDAFDGRTIKCSLSGSGALKADLSYDSARFNASGSGATDLRGRFGRLELGISGSGATRLEGQAEELRLGISGSGRVLAKDLSVGKVRLDASGSADIELRAKDSLEAQLSGSGRLRYWGNPDLDTHTSGSGRVIKAGD